MKCDDWAELLDLYLDHELPKELSLRLERHLMRCAACSFEARTLEQTISLLREAVSPAEIPAVAVERMEARLLKHLTPHLKPPVAAGGQRTLRLT